MNSSANIDISNYSFTELKKCTRPFQEYKEDHGDAPPVNTGYSLLDGVGNWSASLFGVKTNQTYVKQILDILNGVEKDYEQKRYLTEPSAVAFALENIKKIYDQMLKSGIKTGKTFDALAILFGHFNFPYKESGDQYDQISKRIFRAVRDIDSAPVKEEPKVSVSSSLTSLTYS